MNSDSCLNRWYYLSWLLAANEPVLNMVRWLGECVSQLALVLLAPKRLHRELTRQSVAQQGSRRDPVGSLCLNLLPNLNSSLPDLLHRSQRNFQHSIYFPLSPTINFFSNLFYFPFSHMHATYFLFVALFYRNFLLLFRL